MAEIRNKADDTDEAAGAAHGVSPEAAEQESHGGYGGTDRLKTETAALRSEGDKDRAPDH